MTYAISDGPPCEEASHGWTAADGSTAPPINPGWTHSEDVIVTMGDPAGFYSLPDADNNVQALIGQPGDAPLPSEEGGKTIVYPLLVQAKSPQLLRTTAGQLRHAFQDRDRLGTMLLTPHTAYSDIVWQYQARVIGMEPTGRFNRVEGFRLPFQQPHRLSLRLMDARFYVAGDPESITGDDGDTVTATNEGLANTDPTFQIVTSGGDIHLENLAVMTSAGHADLWLRDVPAGTVTISFRPRGLLIGTDSAEGYFDSANTDWWDELIPGLKPGDNGIKVTGGSWTMTWRHASR
jgi:hypothetical protein